MSDVYMFVRPARTPRTVAITLAWLALCLALWVIWSAPLTLVLVLAIFCLPALYEIIVDSRAELRIDNKEISWKSGRREGAMPRGQLEKVRLDTRLDFSLRMTLMTYQGGKLRLPYECVPPAKEVAAALVAQDIPFERHYFALMG